MKRTPFICMVILGIIALSACKPGNVKPDFEKQIVGKWEVKTYYYWYHDLTDEIWSSEESYTLPDANYIGYDSIEFNADKTSRWHRSDLYVQQGMYDDPYATFNWQIVDDTLIIASELKYAIKELNKNNLVIEEYANNGGEQYGHHHWEQIHRYTLKRAR